MSKRTRENLSFILAGFCLLGFLFSSSPSPAAKSFDKLTINSVVEVSGKLVANVTYTINGNQITVANVPIAKVKQDVAIACPVLKFAPGVMDY